MATDMSLGGGAGFGAGYTPIQFAPLVSLTGPVMAPATPAAPEAAAPMAPALRLPQMSDMPDNAYMTGGIPQFTGAPIGERSGAEIRGDLGRIGEFFMSPLSTMASYAMTGKMPSEQMQGLLGGAGSNPFAEFLQGLQGLFTGGKQAAEVPLGGSSAGGLASQGLGMGSAVFSDAMNAALASGASEEAANLAGRTALGLFAQGMDPASAVALGSVTQISRNPFDMTTPAPGIPNSTRNPAVNEMFQTLASFQQFAPGSSETGPGGTALNQEGSYGSYGGGSFGETGAPGESSYGLDR